jgi:hypothetical protein
MLPADSDPALLQETVQRLSAAFDADIAVYGPQGRLLAAAGRPIPRDEIERTEPAILRDLAETCSELLQNSKSDREPQKRGGKDDLRDLDRH